jgi:hypothetical protein
MSDSEGSPVPPLGTSPPPQRNGCLTAFMVLAGIAMLLPGLCALIFGGLSLGDSHVDSTVISLVLLGLLVGVGGILLIRAAIRGPRR